MAELTDSIHDLKCSIQKKTEIEPKRQSSTHQGELLEDKEIIGFHDITYHSVAVHVAGEV